MASPVKTWQSRLDFEPVRHRDSDATAGSYGHFRHRFASIPNRMTALDGFDGLRLIAFAHNVYINGRRVNEDVRKPGAQRVG